MKKSSQLFEAKAFFVVMFLASWFFSLYHWWVDDQVNLKTDLYFAAFYTLCILWWQYSHVKKWLWKKKKI